MQIGLLVKSINVRAHVRIIKIYKPLVLYSAWSYLSLNLCDEWLSCCGIDCSIPKFIQFHFCDHLTHLVWLNCMLIKSLWHIKLHACRYHSESGWQTLLEIFVEHYGLEVDQSAITIFVCLIPVIIDACVKLWVCFLQLYGGFCFQQQSCLWWLSLPRHGKMSDLRHPLYTFYSGCTSRLETNRLTFYFTKKINFVKCICC